MNQTPNGPRVEAGEPPLAVFVSSVMNDDLQSAREVVALALDSEPFLTRWAFELDDPAREVSGPQ